jgi:hypothetical protein
LQSTHDEARAIYTAHFWTASRKEWWRSAWSRLTVLAGLCAVIVPLVLSLVESMSILSSVLMAFFLAGLFVANQYEDQMRRESAQYIRIAACWKDLCSRAEAFRSQLRAEWDSARIPLSLVRGKMNELMALKSSLDRHPDSIPIRQDIDATSAEVRKKSDIDRWALRAWAEAHPPPVLKRGPAVK